MKLYYFKIIIQKSVFEEVNIPITPYNWHKILWVYFPGESKRCFVFDVVETEHLLTFDVVSTVVPQDTKKWNRHFIFPTQVIDVEKIRVGDVFKYSILTHPTKCVNGKIISLILDESWDWFSRKAKENGFVLLNNAKQIASFRTPFEFLKEGQSRTEVCPTHFEGTLCVTDSELFANALVNGIGRGKVYGCGKLNIEPLS